MMCLAKKYTYDVRLHTLIQYTFIYIYNPIKYPIHLWYPRDIYSYRDHIDIWTYRHLDLTIVSRQFTN